MELQTAFTAIAGDLAGLRARANQAITTLQDRHGTPNLTGQAEQLAALLAYHLASATRDAARLADLAQQLDAGNPLSRHAIDRLALAELAPVATPDGAEAAGRRAYEEAAREVKP